MRPSAVLWCVFICLAALAAAAALAASGDERFQSGNELAVTRLTRTHFPKFFLDVSPDGTHIVYARHYPHRRAANQVLVGLHLVGFDGAGDHRILGEFDRTVQIQEHPHWSPDGRRIALSGGGNDTANSSKDTFLCDVDKEFGVTNLRKLVPGASVNVGEEPCWSPDGRRLLATTVTEQLVTIDADGKNRVAVLQSSGVYLHQPAWSQDGEWIAFASDRTDNNVEIYKVRKDGSDLTRITKDAALDSRPRWSPDGQWLLFTSNRTGNLDLFVMRADGSGVRNLTNHSAIDDHPAWSPDGRWFVFVSMRDGGFDIYRAAVPAELAVVALAATNPAPDAIKKPVGGSTEPAAPATDGLVAHFDFDADTDSQAHSRVGKITGTLKGPTRVAGKLGKAIQFDGKDDMVDFGDPAALRLTDKLTIAMWVKPDAPPSTGEPLLFGRGTESWGLTYYTDRQVWFYIAGGGNQLKHAIEPKEWSHIAATFDGKTMRLFVNGEQRGDRQSMFDATTNPGSVLAGVDLVKQTHFSGALDEIRVYGRALSAQEIEQLAEAK